VCSLAKLNIIPTWRGDDQPEVDFDSCYTSLLTERNLALSGLRVNATDPVVDGEGVSYDVSIVLIQFQLNVVN